MFAITENPRSNFNFRVETKSSETPPPSTPETRQLTVVAPDELVNRRRRTPRCGDEKEGNDGGGGGWGGRRGLIEKSVTRDRKKARAEAAMGEGKKSLEDPLCGLLALAASINQNPSLSLPPFYINLSASCEHADTRRDFSSYIKEHIRE